VTRRGGVGVGTRQRQKGRADQESFMPQDGLDVAVADLET